MGVRQIKMTSYITSVLMTPTDTSRLVPHMSRDTTGLTRFSRSDLSCHLCPAATSQRFQTETIGQSTFRTCASDNAELSSAAWRPVLSFASNLGRYGVEKKKNTKKKKHATPRNACKSSFLQTGNTESTASNRA